MQHKIDYTRHQKHTRGFTLIELLVVIAIIALLISIIMPALKLAKMQTQSTVCKNNLRQMAIAAQLYTYDYDNKFVPFLKAEGYFVD